VTFNGEGDVANRHSGNGLCKQTGVKIGGSITLGYFSGTANADKTAFSLGRLFLATKNAPRCAERLERKGMDATNGGGESQPKRALGRR
jgi:hypothetical protein